MLASQIRSLQLFPAARNTQGPLPLSCILAETIMGHLAGEMPNTDQSPNTPHGGAFGLAKSTAEREKRQLVVGLPQPGTQHPHETPKHLIG